MPSVRIKMPGKIKNFEDLALGKTRKMALEIIEAGLEAIDTEKVVRATVRIEEDRLFVKGEIFSLEKSNMPTVVSNIFLYSAVSLSFNFTLAVKTRDRDGSD